MLLSIVNLSAIFSILIMNSAFRNGYSNKIMFKMTTRRGIVLIFIHKDLLFLQSQAMLQRPSFIQHLILGYSYLTLKGLTVLSLGAWSIIKNFLMFFKHYNIPPYQKSNLPNFIDRIIGKGKVIHIGKVPCIMCFMEQRTQTFFIWSRKHLYASKITIFLNMKNSQMTGETHTLGKFIHILIY